MTHSLFFDAIVDVLSVSISPALRFNIKLDKLPEIFPVKAQANLSDKEVYFSVPISVSAEATAKTVVKPREICLWPPENAIAFCYSPTPLSNGNEFAWRRRRTHLDN
ncbi:MAG: hypothetical protein Ct9H300mP13_4930 [Gammaproteobacteria bacterium]|nr:MAG: hypothetical protein Ct9H300mP13_4930 [Gammaproteobacteria bacterium]